MNSLVIKNELQLSQWASVVQEAETCGVKKLDWLRSKGITKDQYYYWRRKVMDHSLKAVNASFVEVPQPATHPGVADSSSSDRIAASISFGTSRLNIHDSASAGFISKLLKAVSDAQ